MFTVSVRASHLFKVLLAINISLAALSLVFLVATEGLGIDAGVVASARKFVDLDTEQNLPSWYSAMLLCLTGLVTLEVGRRAIAEKLRHRWHWFVLGLGFLYLSLDELVGLHEKMGVAVSAVVGREGVLRYSWLALAVPAVAVVCIAYLGFLRSQPSRILRLMLVGGALYVGGAVLLEAVESAAASAGADESGLLLGLLVTVEEFCEMLGPTVFLVALTLVQQNWTSDGPGRRAPGAANADGQSSSPRAAKA